MEVLPGEAVSTGSHQSPLTQPVAVVAESIALNLAVPIRDSKAAIRRSLSASTIDGVFATIFANVTGGVLLSNFLVELDATPIEVGMLSSIPMLANLLQPIGAYWSEQTTSRHFYCLWICGPSRLLWLILVVNIAAVGWGKADPHQLINWTLAIVLVSHFLGALGSASWLSWLALLVPRRLRGRYFGLRNSAMSLVNLMSVPVLGWMISAWAGGSLQGYSFVLLLGVVAGLISLSFQFLMVDVNPQAQHSLAIVASPISSQDLPDQSSRPEPSQISIAAPLQTPSWTEIFKDSNFLRFLLYLSLWMFAVNVSAPFFNLYLLDDLAIDISWVTLYNSLTAGANLFMLIMWGRIADRVGNRFLLLTVGILVAITPLLWLGTGANPTSVWIWLPLLHVLSGATWAAIDLCTNNLQIGVAPPRDRASYFAIAAAIAGVSGALGATTGGLLTQFAHGGLLSLFALSSGLRLVALLPLLFIHERSR